MTQMPKVGDRVLCEPDFVRKGETWPQTIVAIETSVLRPEKQYAELDSGSVVRLEWLSTAQEPSHYRGA